MRLVIRPVKTDWRTFVKDYASYLIGKASLVGALMLAACAAPDPEKSAPPPEREDVIIVPDATDLDATDPSIDQRRPDIKIAFLVPLSGPEAGIGKALLNAALMAVSDARDPRLQLLPFDTAADIITAETAAQQAIAAGSSMIIGPLLADNVRAAGDIAVAAGIPLLGLSNDREAAAKGRYILGFSPEDEVRRVVAEALRRGYRRFAGLFPEGRYGDRVRIAFGKAVNKLGGTVSALESYPQDANAIEQPVRALADYDRRRRELRAEIDALRALNDDMTDAIADDLDEKEVLSGAAFDVVFLAEGGALARTLIPLLPFYEIDPAQVQFIGTGLWDDRGLYGEPALSGAWFAAPDPVRRQAWQRRYTDIFGSSAPRLATLAYDAVGLAAALVRADYAKLPMRPTLSGADIASILFDAKALTAVTGFDGVDGLFRLLHSGLNERALAVLEVRGRFSQVLSPAATRFPRFGDTLTPPALSKLD